MYMESSSKNIFVIESDIDGKISARRMMVLRQHRSNCKRMQLCIYASLTEAVEECVCYSRARVLLYQE